MRNFQTISSLELQKHFYEDTGVLSHLNVDHLIARIQREILVLRMEQKAISKRIEVIRKTAVGLEDVFGCEAINGKLKATLSVGTSQRRSGLTESCQKRLEESGAPVTVRQMLEWMRQQRPDLLGHQKHPEVALRVVLKRLVSYGKAEEIARGDGPRSWRAACSSSLRTSAEQ